MLDFPQRAARRLCDDVALPARNWSASSFDRCMTQAASAAGPQENAAAASAAALLGVARDLVAEVHAHDHVSPDVSLASTLDRDLGLDSMARVELLARVERRFAVQLPETVLGTVTTVGELLRQLQAMQRALATPDARAAPPLTAGVAAPASTATLMEALRWHAEHQPDRVHVVFTGGDSEAERLTYGALERKAAMMAGGLAARGLRPGDRAALMLPTGTDFLASFYAVLFAGAIRVPLYPPPGPSRIADHLSREAGILENCGVRLLITVREVRPFARMLRARAPAIEHVVDPANLASGGAAPSHPSPDGIALLQYTSDSTGHPKGVVLTHGNLLANIRAMGRAVHIARDDVFVSWLPLYHDMGLIGAWLGSLYFGTPLVLMSPLAFLQRPQHWLRCIHQYRGTLSGGPNFAYELCLKRICDEELARSRPRLLALRIQWRRAGQRDNAAAVRRALRALGPGCACARAGLRARGVQRGVDVHTRRTRARHRLHRSCGIPQHRPCRPYCVRNRDRHAGRRLRIRTPRASRAHRGSIRRATARAPGRSHTVLRTVRRRLLP